MTHKRCALPQLFKTLFVVFIFQTKILRITLHGKLERNSEKMQQSSKYALKQP